MLRRSLRRESRRCRVVITGRDLLNDLLTGSIGISDIKLSPFCFVIGQEGGDRICVMDGDGNALTVAAARCILHKRAGMF